MLAPDVDSILSTAHHWEPLSPPGVSSDVPHMWAVTPPMSTKGGQCSLFSQRWETAPSPLHIISEQTSGPEQAGGPRVMHRGSCGLDPDKARWPGTLSWQGTGIGPDFPRLPPAPHGCSGSPDHKPLQKSGRGKQAAALSQNCRPLSPSPPLASARGTLCQEGGHCSPPWDPLALFWVLWLKQALPLLHVFNGGEK